MVRWHWSSTVSFRGGRVWRLIEVDGSFDGETTRDESLLADYGCYRRDVDHEPFVHRAMPNSDRSAAVL